jgi:hypothetical protein
MGVKPAGGDGFQVDGALTIRGTTRPITLDVQVHGRARDPWGGERIGLSATTTLNRTDFGLTWNQALEAGGFLVGDSIQVDLDVEAVRIEAGELVAEALQDGTGADSDAGRALERERVAA